MKISGLDEVLKDINDQPAKSGNGDFTLRQAMKQALGDHVPSDAGVDAKAKEHCYDLMLAVKSANGELEISTEDAALIKKRIAEMYAPWIAGQAAKMIENKREQPQ